MDWCYPMMLVGKNEGVVETITANQVIDKEHTSFDNYVKCVLDGVIFYLHISQEHFYETILCGRALGFTHHADTLYVGTEDDIRVDS